MFDELRKKANNLKKTETTEKTLIKMVGSDFAIKPQERRSVLILSEYLLPYHDYLHKSVEKVLLTSKNTLENADKKILDFYKHFEGFDHYETNPLVIYRAAELHNTHKFTHVSFSLH